MSTALKKATTNDATPAARQSKWKTTEATEFVNSLCPNAQYPFPIFEWCDSEERKLLREACTVAFDTIRASWQIGVFDRIGALNKTEQRILAVVEMKTLRFNKLLEKIPRKTFSKGEDSEDRLGFELVPVSGLSDGKLTTGLASLKKSQQIGCIKAEKHNGRDASNIYCVHPIYRTISLFYRVANEELLKRLDEGLVDETRCNVLINGLLEEITTRCKSMFEEDRQNFSTTETMTNPSRAGGDRAATPS